ncbi:MAG: hypothetical protein ACYTHN_19685 [Planctomycetota bacterium]
MIDENRGKVQWIEKFERPDSYQLARKWEQREGRGPVMRIHKGRVVIEGQNMRRGETLLERKVEAEKFVRFEADLICEISGPFDAGIGIAYKRGTRVEDVQGGIRIGKNEKGKLVIWEWDVAVNRWKENKETTFGDWPLMQDKVNRLGIEMVRDPEATREAYMIQFMLNGAPLGEPFQSDRFRRTFRSGEIWPGIFMDADSNTRVKLEVDNVRLVTRK